MYGTSPCRPNIIMGWSHEQLKQQQQQRLQYTGMEIRQGRPGQTYAPKREDLPLVSQSQLRKRHVGGPFPRWMQSFRETKRSISKNSKIQKWELNCRTRGEHQLKLSENLQASLMSDMQLSKSEVDQLISAYQLVALTYKLWNVCHHNTNISSKKNLSRHQMRNIESISL